MSIAQFIDHTLLKPSATLADIEKTCNESIENGFAAVCIPPYFVKDARQILGKKKPKLATVIGFPFGYSHYSAKLAEIDEAITEGADEIDIVMNIAAFKSNDLAYLETEIDSLTRLAKEKNLLVKLIIETGILTNEEIIRCCDLYQHFPVDFLKTSTGYAERGASVETVQLMRKHLPASIRIKASGGIRNFEFAKQLIEAGATRLGCSASLAIVKGEEGEGGY
ncbi:MAG: deoxyribose-phosphate aldolase [Flavisolibacter sp.]